MLAAIGVSSLDQLINDFSGDALVVEVQRIADGLFDVVIALRDGQLPAWRE